jgi:hypothetical protein
MIWHAVIAQCVMCYRTAAAQQLERSRVLNSGIAILLVPPILVLAGILLLAYRRSAAVDGSDMIADDPHDASDLH